MTETIKIVRGYYLTGVGQEPLAYYFKLPADNPTFNSISAGDVALTFYQNGESITSIPAKIRVDSVITNEKLVSEYLLEEKKDHCPMLPIIHVYEPEQFDPLIYQKMMEEFAALKTEIKHLAKVDYIQTTIFDFLDEGVSM